MLFHDSCRGDSRCCSFIIVPTSGPVPASYRPFDVGLDLVSPVGVLNPKEPAKQSTTLGREAAEVDGSFRTFSGLAFLLSRGLQPVVSMGSKRVDGGREEVE